MASSLFLTLCSTQIFKKDVDEHQQQVVPHCELMAWIIEDNSQVKPLICSLDILGTTEKEKYFTFVIHPGMYSYTVYENYYYLSCIAIDIVSSEPLQKNAQCKLEICMLVG